MWELVDLPPPVAEAELLTHAQAVFAKEERKPLSEDAEFLWDSLLAEKKKDVAGAPVSLATMDQIHGEGQWSGLPCFCVTQATGKRRRIDNGKAGWTNAATTYSEKFGMNSAYAPAIAAGALEKAVSQLSAERRAECLRVIRVLESGGEDMPDAFRSIPTPLYFRQ